MLSLNVVALMDVNSRLEDQDVYICRRWAILPTKNVCVVQALYHDSGYGVNELMKAYPIQYSNFVVSDHIPLEIPSLEMITMF